MRLGPQKALGVGRPFPRASHVDPKRENVADDNAVRERRLFLAAAGIAARKVQSAVVEPEQRPSRALALLELTVDTPRSRAPGPALPGITLLVPAATPDMVELRPR